MDIRKNKNFVEFVENDNVVKFNVNSGEFIGVSGRTVRTVPVLVRELFDEFTIRYNNKVDNSIVRFLQSAKQRGKIKLNDTAFLRQDKTLKIMSLLDRVESMGVKSRSFCVEDYFRLSDEKIDFLNSHFLELIKWYNEHTLSVFSIDDFFHEMAKAEVLNLINTEMADHLTSSMVNYLTRFYNNYIPKRLRTETNLNRVANYFIRGLWDYYEDSDGYEINKKLENLAKWCIAMGENLPKGDFFKGYIETKRRYETKKAEFDAKALVENQNAHRNALTFEDENLMVIIPTTSAEFVEEGERQKNCVARLYLPRVIDGKTNVVFVREKSNPTKNYITCEVRDGNIVQFLLAHNSHDVSDNDNDFRMAYQKHLRNNWGN